MFCPPGYEYVYIITLLKSIWKTRRENERKIETWNEIYYNGNVEITDEINEKNVMVIDDLYQSGTTMWEYAKFLKNSGARSVWGLVCVKSLRDSDNR